MSNYDVSLSVLVKQLNLTPFHLPCDADEIKITAPEVNRPGFLLTGYEEFFDTNRIQILGNAEMGYLKQRSSEMRYMRLKTLFSTNPPAIVLTGDAQPSSDLLELAEKYKVPLLGSAEASTAFMNAVLSLLSVELAQRVTRHGVLVDVYGEGVLIMGESGVGKSETAVELLKRGHRLIADDAVELRRVSNRTIYGQAPENIRHFIELRGVGIINVGRIFGAGAVKKTQSIDLVVELEPWNKHKNYSRTGLENNTIEILGLKIPLTVIPVMPGRNLAVIVEIAAMNNRQKAMGYNAAFELLNQLGLTNDIPQAEEVKLT